MYFYTIARVPRWEVVDNRFTVSRVHSLSVWIKESLLRNSLGAILFSVLSRDETSTKPNVIQASDQPNNQSRLLLKWCITRICNMRTTSHKYRQAMNTDWEVRCSGRELYLTLRGCWWKRQLLCDWSSEKQTLVKRMSGDQIQRVFNNTSWRHMRLYLLSLRLKIYRNGEKS